MLKTSKEFGRFLKRILSTRRAKRRLLAAAGLFIAANLLVSLAYHDRTYPKTQVAGHQFGSVSAGDLTERLQHTALLPKEIRFTNGKASAKVPLAELKIRTDYPAIEQRSLDRPSWLPVAGLVTTHDVPLQLKADQTALQSAIAATLPTFQSDPSDAKIEPQGGSFVIKADKAGQKVDTEATGRRLIAALETGKTQVSVAIKPLSAGIQAASLQKPLQDLKAQSKTAVSLHYDGKTRRFSQAEVSGWFSPDKASMILSEPAVRSAVAAAGGGFGIRVQNQDQATEAIKSAIQTRQDLTYTLVAAPPAVKTLSYCTAVRGVDAAEIPTLAAKLKLTFADNRGWSLGGLVGLDYDAAGAKCDFTVWLTAADQMPSFGAICDPEWSCAVTPNVIINYDRWRYASTAWNNQGGTLEDYRSMVINHETGHWFGFNHTYCPGAGQAAPVMQQQSIDLQGCSFNPWPTAAEQAALKQRLGL